MQEYLLFQLYGPFQSWGDVAVGEIRPDARRPTKSALLGLLAGALGVRRDHDETHMHMVESYGTAVRQDAAGIPFRDYHTVQTASARKGRIYRCRKDMLDGMLDQTEDLHTIITYRDYLADAGFSVCIWTKVDQPPFTLHEMAEALRHPVFVPYLGRKSCPPGLPFAPRVLEAENPANAFSGYPMDGRVAGELFMESQASVELFWDSGVDAGVRETRIESPRDVPVSRNRWQFAPRDMSVGAVEAPKHREWK